MNTAKINKIIIASDHAGFSVKSRVVDYLKSHQFEVVDVGTHSEDRVDYPDIAHQAIERFFSESGDLVVLICGTGIGMSIVANKHKGIRCALVHDGFTAKMAREHNHANCLALAARGDNAPSAEHLLEAFLASQEEAGRHLQRINKIMELDNE